MFPPAGQADWVGQVASALIALSLSHTSAYGFAGTVNRGNAQTFINSNLEPANASFWALAIANINQEMIKLNPGVDPGAWFQRFYANLYKVQALNSAAVPGVIQTWNGYIGGRASPTPSSWTVYDHMLAARFSYDTFFQQVLTAIDVSQSDTRTLGCRGGPAASCTVKTKTTHGAQVNSWLSSNKSLPGGFINGPTRDNEESRPAGVGCCFVYSYASADIDAPAHAAQLVRVVPELSARHLGPWVAEQGQPAARPQRSLIPLVLLGLFATLVTASPPRT